jgi:hypothetical protein
MEENSKLCARASAKSSLSAVVPSRLTKVPPPQTYDIFTNKQTQIEISTIHRSRERLGRVEETIARQE